MLDTALLFPAISDLAAEGYNWVSVSGGEPLLYPELPQLLRHSKGQGLNNTIVSNGMLLRPRALDRLQPHLDLLVISIDGIPDSHNAMRGNQRAFELMAANIGELRERGIRFGFIFTLTQHNLHELPWVAEFAVNSGARLLQVHPLEEYGNAAKRLPGKVPDGTEGAYAWALAQHIEKRFGGRMAVQVDLLHSSVIRDDPGLVYAAEADPAEDAALSELISPLIIEPDGALLPLQYGFPRALALGALDEAAVPTLARRWRKTRWPVLRALCARLQQRIAGAPEPYFCNWYEEIAALAAAELGAAPAAPVHLVPRDLIATG